MCRETLGGLQNQEPGVQIKDMSDRYAVLSGSAVNLLGIGMGDAPRVAGPGNKPHRVQTDKPTLLMSTALEMLGMRYRQHPL
jgi:hypothetical protein